MTQTTQDGECINCGRDELEIPILQLSYQREALWICSSCLPVLIHNPKQLQGRLRGADHLDASPYDHD